MRIGCDLFAAVVVVVWVAMAADDSVDYGIDAAAADAEDNDAAVIVVVEDEVDANAVGTSQLDV